VTGRRTWMAALATVLACCAASARGAPVLVAVFNFQMTRGDDQYQWIAKGLADRITTDFTRSRRLYVVARDQMQILAHEMQWVPEMALGDPSAAARIRKELQIDYLVTGTYSVEGGRLQITAQTVDLDKRKAVARAVVTGQAADFLSLQRQISAELLSWFSGVPAERILDQLPVWTRSVPATRALYEGMNLYDQGRYSEAWLRFRQSWRSDPSYLEAHYWVARMYYFMDRYEHARRAYEKFVYMDRSHPRIGDAIKEYLHTYEQLDSRPETLLKLYADFLRRFPDALVYREMGLNVPVRMESWLLTRSAQVLDGLGRHREATLLASRAMVLLTEQIGCMGPNPGWAHRLARHNAAWHNLLTGEVLTTEGLRGGVCLVHRYGQVHLRPGATTVTSMLDMPARCQPVSDGRNTEYQWVVPRFLLSTEDGYRIRGLKLYPLIDGDDGQTFFRIDREARKDAVETRQVPIAQAREEGLVLEDIPFGGLFVLAWGVRPGDPARDPKLVLRGIRVEGELEPIRAHGAVHVICQTTDMVRISVDGRHQRLYNGLVGLLTPGEHEVTVTGYNQLSGPFQPVTRKALVEEGKTTTLRVDLPAKKGFPTEDWQVPVLIGRDPPASAPCLQHSECPPTIQADEDAVRVFWSSRGDLWQSTSPDGRAFGPPQRLPMPVSSGWMEMSPRCVRDEAGRLILAFRSDREGQHQERAYVAWSRNGERWSSPAMVADRTVADLDILRDRSDRLLWVDGSQRTATVMTSRDARRWETLASIRTQHRIANTRILQRLDGSYELFLGCQYYFGGFESYETSRVQILRLRSRDGRQWSAPTLVREFTWETHVQFSPVHIDGRTHLAVKGWLVETLDLAGEQADGSWREAKVLRNVLTWNMSMAHHPKWGYMLVWRRPPDMRDVIETSGPYFMRGPSLEKLYAGDPPIQRPAP
jgi:TolB-like protein